MIMAVTLLDGEHFQPARLTTLRKLARQAATSPAAKCELCGTPITEQHEHLLELKDRRLLCACLGCGILFSDARSGRFRRVPNSAERLPEFQLSDPTWESFLIPINLAFFFYDSAAERVVAMYPSPAGAMESTLDLSAWQEVITANSQLSEMQSDVEALLVNRMGSSRDYYLVSIDRCYELVGLIRLHWRGLSGGQEVWKHVTAFFETLNYHTPRGSSHG